MNHYSLWNYKRLNGRKPYFKTQQLPLLHSELYELGKVKYEHVYGAFARYVNVSIGTPPYNLQFNLSFWMMS
jgi:hypothetical protein